jgi:hypothetical protein
MSDTLEHEPGTISPRTEPTRRDRDEDNRSIVVRWNIGEPNADGGQRQARFEVTYMRGHGYLATVTTVIETMTDNGYSDFFTVSLMKLDRVYQLRAARYAAKNLTLAFDMALEQLTARFDSGEPIIVRHFDPTAPIPQD